MVFYGLEATAQTALGQAILKLADRLLWIVEKSAQWSVPTEELTSGENGKSFGKIELVRPLPWILFLPSLLMLRMLRFGINITASVLGYSKMQPADMVHIIQRGRRRIRAVKSSGLKSIRMKKSQTSKGRALSNKEESKRLAKSLRLILSTLSCLDSGQRAPPSPPPTKICVSSSSLDTVPHIMEERATTEPSVSPSQADHKRKFSEVSSNDDSDSESDEEPLLAKIDRLANQSGTDDSYVPSVTEEDESSDSELDMSISMSEVKEVQDGCEVVKESCRGGAERTGPLLDDEQNTREDLESCAKKVHLLTIATSTEESERPCEKYGESASEGVIGNDLDTAYYSPISWKSISPDLSFSSDTQDEVNNSKDNSNDIQNGGNHVDKREKSGVGVPNGKVKGKNKNPSHNSNNRKNQRKRRSRVSREKN